uniref:Uncharacterized protein n=1 Tax=Pediastrum duplex TaxID=3105 RepID=A0A2U8GIG0_PEDDU|nr:hypothetical protein [Pediastrum duplex]
MLFYFVNKNCPIFCSCSFSFEAHRFFASSLVAQALRSAKKKKRRIKSAIKDCCLFLHMLSIREVKKTMHTELKASLLQSVCVIKYSKLQRLTKNSLIEETAQTASF